VVEIRFPPIALLVCDGNRPQKPAPLVKIGMDIKVTEFLVMVPEAVYGDMLCMVTGSQGDAARANRDVPPALYIAKPAIAHSFKPLAGFRALTVVKMSTPFGVLAVYIKCRIMTSSAVARGSVNTH
jgi:hypothetical protein